MLLNKIISGRRFHTAILAAGFEWFVLSRLNWSLFIHPVSAFAYVMERLFGAGYKRGGFYGMLWSCALTAVTVALGCGLHGVLYNSVLGWLFEVLIVASLFAHGCLFAHVDRILDRVYSAEFALSKHSLAMTVGRSVSYAGESEVCAVSILSLVENFCDAAVAPLLYYLFLGLPGLLTYKVVELADSVYGSRKLEDCASGRCVATLDDILNYVPSRVLGVLFLVMFYALSFGKYRVAIAYSDANSLVSLNNALSEAAVARYLGIKLNGDRCYGNVLIKDRLFNASGRAASGLDIKRAQAVIIVAWLVLINAAVTVLFFLPPPFLRFKL